MHNRLGWVLALVLTAGALTAPWAWGSASPCSSQPDYRMWVPGQLLDPNAAEPRGPDPVLWQACAVLGPAPLAPGQDAADPALWRRPVGRFLRTGPWCVDPNWLLASIQPVPASSSSASVVTVDRAGRTWTLAASVQPGWNYWLVRAVQRHPLDSGLVRERLVWIVVWGEVPAAEPPTLF